MDPTPTPDLPTASPEPTSEPPAPAPTAAAPRDPLAGARDVAARLRRRLSAAILGRDEVIELVLVALFADGHVLLEDYPGSGKTTLAKALGDAIDDPAHGLPGFRRVQFTPDLLPSDVTGVTIFEPDTRQFVFRPGPIFAHVVLADEVNRTSPKVQAAMLEAMAEKQVTTDAGTRALDDLFFVIATQNPLDVAGTYPLPVAQLDRFLFKVRMEHVSRQAELAVLATLRERKAPPADPRVSRDEVLAARAAIEAHVHVAEPIRECLVDVAAALRADDRALQGISTRSLVLAVPALQALACLRGRDYVRGEDLETLAPRLFAHRLELQPGVDDPGPLIAAALATGLERLARRTLER